jgi:hypothetical protein
MRESGLSPLSGRRGGGETFRADSAQLIVCGSMRNFRSQGKQRELNPYTGNDQNGRAVNIISSGRMLAVLCGALPRHDLRS